MKSEVYKRQVKRRDEILAAILDAASCIQKHDQLRRKKAIFVYELQCALRLTVGFSKIYCVL